MSDYLKRTWTFEMESLALGLSGTYRKKIPKVDKSTQTDFVETKPKPTNVFDCNGVSAEVLPHVFSVHGYTFLDKNKYLWGYLDAPTNKFLSIRCTKIVNYSCKTCGECKSLQYAIKKAEERKKKSMANGTDKYTPISPLKFPPLAIEMLENFKKNEAELLKKVTKQSDRPNFHIEDVNLSSFLYVFSFL